MNRVCPGPAALTGRSDDPFRVRTLRPVLTERTSMHCSPPLCQPCRAVWYTGIYLYSSCARRMCSSYAIPHTVVGEVLGFPSVCPLGSVAVHGLKPGCNDERVKRHATILDVRNFFPPAATQKFGCGRRSHWWRQGDSVRIGRILMGESNAGLALKTLCRWLN